MRARPVLALSLSVLCAGALALAGCSSSGGSDQIKVGAVIHGLDNPFFVTMQQGMQDAGAEYGVSVSVQAPDSNDDDAAQEALLADMVGEGFDCFVVDPCSATALNQGIVTLTQEGTPVVNVDTPVDIASLEAAGGTIAAFIGSDNREAGAQAGAALAEGLGAMATIGLIAGPEGNVASNDRIAGATAAIGEANFIGPVLADWDTGEAYAAARAMIAANPDISGFFAANDQMAQGVIEAVTESGKAIRVIGVDGIQPMLEDVQGGTAFATVAQYPYVMGKLGVEACIVAVQGGQVKDRVASPIVLVTAANVDEVIADQPQPPDAYDDPYASLIAK